MFIKVRHQPFSVYLRFLSPADRKGEEAIYVEGRNNGNLLGHTPFWPGRLAGTVSLNPKGVVAMYGQRHPIMDMGLLKLTRLMQEAIEKHVDGGCKIPLFADEEIDGRPCRHVEAEVPHLTSDNPHGIAVVKILIDKQLDVPVSYEQYDWSGKAGDKPRLMESYTYRELKLNNGFTDEDFDVKNPKYGFR